MLEAQSIIFGYGRRGDRGKGTAPVIDDVSLAISSGERVYLSAPSGSGKTTLCRIMAGFIKPWGGEVLVDGDVLPRHGICPVQLIGQHPEHVLDPRRRMRESLAEAGWDPNDAADATLLERLGIRERWLTRFPHELSGGEMQRFCIARALLAHPRYLIADEISTMLDMITQERIWQVLKEEQDKHGFGVLFTTHSPALADRIATRCVKLPE